ncbi:MAG: 50S ribosomal protein L25 [Dehalococcoidia bacterium]
MAERLTIPAEQRTVIGKKVATLRRAGRLPANVFGKGLASVAIELDAREFGRTIKAAGVRSLFDLAIQGEPMVRPVVLRGVTRKGGTGDPIHVDFYQVDTTKPISATVPLRLIGEAPAVRDLAGVLIQSLDVVHIRCYPLAIPEAIEVDAGKLISFDVSVVVGDAVLPPGVELVTDPAVVVASVAAPRIRLEDAAAEPSE